VSCEGSGILSWGEGSRVSWLIATVWGGAILKTAFRFCRIALLVHLEDFEKGKNEAFLPRTSPFRPGSADHFTPYRMP
jgi:hypothetical protein